MAKIGKTQFLSTGFFEGVKVIGAGLALLSGFVNPFPFAWAFGVVAALIWWLFCEGVLVFFRIYEKLCDIEEVLLEQGRSWPVRGGEPPPQGETPTVEVLTTPVVEPPLNSTTTDPDPWKKQEPKEEEPSQSKYWGPPKG